MVSPLATTSWTITVYVGSVGPFDWRGISAETTDPNMNPPSSSGTLIPGLAADTSYHVQAKFQVSATQGILPPDVSTGYWGVVAWAGTSSSECGSTTILNPDNCVAYGSGPLWGTLAATAYFAEDQGLDATP